MSDQFVAEFQAERKRLIIDHYRTAGQQWEDEHPEQWRVQEGDYTGYRGYDRPYWFTALKANSDFQKIMGVETQLTDMNTYKEIFWKSVFMPSIPKELMFLEKSWREAFNYLLEDSERAHCYVISPLCVVNVHEDNEYPYMTYTSISGGRAYCVSIDFETLKIRIELQDSECNFFEGE